MPICTRKWVLVSVTIPILHTDPEDTPSERYHTARNEGEKSTTFVPKSSWSQNDASAVSVRQTESVSSKVFSLLRTKFPLFVCLNVPRSAVAEGYVRLLLHKTCFKVAIVFLQSVFLDTVTTCSNYLSVFVHVWHLRVDLQLSLSSRPPGFDNKTWIYFSLR